MIYTLLAKKVEDIKYSWLLFSFFIFFI